MCGCWLGEVSVEVEGRGRAMERWREWRERPLRPARLPVGECGLDHGAQWQRAAGRVRRSLPLRNWARPLTLCRLVHARRCLIWRERVGEICNEMWVAVARGGLCR